MADKVLCEKSDLVAIADSVREATETYSVPELGTAITGGLTEQADLINQIQTALEGKAAGGGGSAVPEMYVLNVNVKILASADIQYACIIYATYEENSIKNKVLDLYSLRPDGGLTGVSYVNQPLNIIKGTSVYLLDLYMTFGIIFSKSDNLTTTDYCDGQAIVITNTDGNDASIAI